MGEIVLRFWEVGNQELEEEDNGEIISSND